MSCPYQTYYTQQAGTGIGLVYKGAPFQRGHGIGSFLGGLFRSILPLLKSGAKFVGKEALNAGAGVLSDIVNSQPIDESVKSRLKVISQNFKRKADEKIDSLMTGSGYKNKRNILLPISRKKASHRKGSKKNTKLFIKDIFSK